MEGERPADASPDPESFTNRKRSRNEHPNPYCHTAPMSAEIRGRRRRRRLGPRSSDPADGAASDSRRARQCTRSAADDRARRSAAARGIVRRRSRPRRWSRWPACSRRCRSTRRPDHRARRCRGLAVRRRRWQVRVHIGDGRLLESGPGGVVGEFAVLAPAPRSASATAIEPSLLLRLRRGPFEELLDDRPEIARAVIVDAGTDAASRRRHPR